VTLMVTDDQGITSEPKRETITVHGNRRPLADFRATPRRGNKPLTVTFTSLSSDPDGDVVAFGWNFGDGRGSIEENPTHTYTSAGEFVVTLMAADERGLTSEVKRQTVSVKVNQPPRADFRADPRRGEAPLTVTFANRSSDPEGDRMTFTWDFGDGTTGTETNPEHSYAGTGMFEVTLTATDYRGARSEQPKREIIEVDE
jgi:PKD repeat protein